MHLLAHSIGSAVIRRINFPKHTAARMTRGQSLAANLRPLLSPADEDDARQTCALVLSQIGLPAQTALGVRTTEKIATLCPLFAGSKCERASYTAAARTLGLAGWKAVFRAVRRALRIDRRVREDATDFTAAPELDVAVEHPEISTERRAKLAKQVRYAHSLLHAALGADSSRKRRSTFRTHLSTLRAFSAIWSGHFAKRPLCDGKSEDALHVALYRFRQFLDKGEAAMTAAALEEIPQRAPERELRSFAQIPENFAVAE